LWLLLPHWLSTSLMDNKYRENCWIRQSPSESVGIRQDPSKSVTDSVDFDRFWSFFVFFEHFRRNPSISVTFPSESVGIRRLCIEIRRNPSISVKIRDGFRRFWSFLIVFRVFWAFSSKSVDFRHFPSLFRQNPSESVDCASKSVDFRPFPSRSVTDSVDFHRFSSFFEFFEHFRQNPSISVNFRHFSVKIRQNPSVVHWNPSISVDFRQDPSSSVAVSVVFRVFWVFLSMSVVPCGISRELL
jgi:hypothetical protein